MRDDSYTLEIWNGLNRPGCRLGTINAHFLPKVGDAFIATLPDTRIDTTVKAVWRTGTHESMPRRYTVILN